MDNPTDDLKAFREAVKGYIRQIRMTEGDFAVKAGFTTKVFSKKINGKSKLNEEDVRAIIRGLAEVRAIQNRSQAKRLLLLMKVPDFPLGDWQAEPLKKLKNDDVSNQASPDVRQTPSAAQSNEEVNLQSSQQTLPPSPRRLKRVITRYRWVIVPAAILVLALLVVPPLWGLFFYTAQGARAGTATPTPTPHQKPPITLPDISWGAPRSITCDDLFNPSSTPTTNTVTCTPTNDGHATLAFNMLQPGYPELDVLDGHGPSGPMYRVELRMDLSSNGVPHITGCIVADTSKNSDAGEVICIHNNGLIEVLDAATMGSQSSTKHLEDREVAISDPAHVAVIVERVNNQLFIQVANQVIDPVTLTTTAANVGFLAVGEYGSIKMTAIELR